MVVAAHPDDPEFGVAGCVARWTEQGDQVYFVICTNGDKGTNDPDMSPARLSELRQQEQSDACAELGVQLEREDAAEPHRDALAVDAGLDRDPGAGSRGRDRGERNLAGRS